MESSYEQVQKSTQGSAAQRIGLWADTLRDCSALGLHYAENPYDRERYQRLQDMAMEMFSFASGQSISEIEPLRTTLFSHPAPFPVSDAAVIDATGRILLIRRADNALWAMPGGALDVGETPAQGAVREVLEETGVSCQPVVLVGVYDSRFCGTPSLHQLYQFSFLCRPQPGADVINPPSHAHEILEVKWFSECELPIDMDPGHIQRIPQAFRVWHGDVQAYFDH